MNENVIKTPLRRQFFHSLIYCEDFKSFRLRESVQNAATRTVGSRVQKLWLVSIVVLRIWLNAPG